MLKMRSLVTLSGLTLLLTASTVLPAASRELPESRDHRERAESSEQLELRNRHELATREFIQTTLTPQTLEPLYAETATQLVGDFQTSFESTLGRSMTVDEQQRLHQFWYRKVAEMFPYEELEQMLTPIYMRHLTLAEIEAIAQFYRTPEGIRLAQLTSTADMRHLTLAEVEAIEQFYRTPEGVKWMQVSTAISREAGIAGENWGRQLASNPEWMTSVLAELQAEFPYLFTGEGKTPTGGQIRI